ncbi:MAG: hypothetical protein DLM50_03545 [Candidatus Meridianibacter frigidus]|nr:MAG: hypothetical protein DLM50_03545 [Candidatus Eremiobacteraeota bacterium]
MVFEVRLRRVIPKCYRRSPRPRKKAVIHIPHVGSAETPKGKNEQVDDVLEFIADGDASRVVRDNVTGFYRVTRPDGAVLKGADLVDDSPYRETVLASLRKVEKRADLDIIIALARSRRCTMRRGLVMLACRCASWQGGTARNCPR